MRSKNCLSSIDFDSASRISFSKCWTACGAGRRSRIQIRALQIPHVPPSFAQCLQYLQFLQAWHGSEPVQVAAGGLRVRIAKEAVRMREKSWAITFILRLETSTAVL